VVRLKKSISTLLIILCLSFISPLIEYKLSVNAENKTLTVDDDGTAGFRSIQMAINNASSGDTIFVLKGTYNESVDINKTVSLIGEDRDLTIIDGYGAADFVISITTDRVKVEGFTVKKSVVNPYDNGIRVLSSSNVIRHNKIIDVKQGIVLYYSSNNLVSDNIIYRNNNDGIGLYLSDRNVFSGNNISRNFDGISLSFSSNNVFSNNTLSNNRRGIMLSFHSNNNTFYHNNFHDAVYVENGLMNVWNYSGEGNYWSNYTGQDLNSDGIGDNPYTIDNNNTDYRPLMGMFSDFAVTLKEETYHITTISNSTISDFGFKIGVETGNKIISFKVTGKNNAIGFCRITIPTALMNYSLIVLVGEEEIIPTSLNISNKANIYLFFTYFQGTQTVTIISSKTLNIYNQLLEKYLKLQTNLYNLNMTYFSLLSNYTAFLNRYNQLQQNYLQLNASYHEHLLDYHESLQNFRNLMYIFAAATAIFIITTIYLSKHIHAGKVIQRQK